jgi:hypothetical protein
MDENFPQAKQRYGLTSDPFVDRQNEGTFVVGGTGDEANAWSRTMTGRAAHQLWFHLTRLLFPEKSGQVTALAKTAPLSGAGPSETTQLDVFQNPDTRLYEIFGWVGDDTWWFRVDDQNARKLWAALDIALYPAGWSGPVTYHKLN